MRALRTSVVSICVLTGGFTVACGNSVTTSGSGTTATTTTSGAGGGGTTTAATTAASGTGGAGGGIGTPSTTYPAPHPAAPKVIDGGGIVLTAPKIVPVFFTNDVASDVQKLSDFTSKIGGTQYWKATTSEYGVGPATTLPQVNATEAPTGTIDDTAIQAWLGTKLNGNDPLYPAADENTVYVLYYPANVTITLSGGPGGTSQSCQSFGGYHSDFALDAAHGNQDVAYAVVPRCPDFGGLPAIDGVTGAASHEMIEAATDPHPMAAPAFGQIDTSHLVWEFFLGGGETGDMCAQFPDVFGPLPPEMPYTVQRTWSNAAAKAGNDPCVPAPAGQVYFNAAPVLNDNVTLAGSFTTKGVKIPVGQSKTIDVDLFSNGPTNGPFTVSAKELTGTPHLNMTFDQSQGENGQVLHLTIQVKSAGHNNTERFILESSLGNQRNIWVGLVGN